MKFRKYKIPESASMQLAPMIDIVFLLLIFFIVTWAYARFETELDISVPSASEGQSPKRTVGEIIVNVHKDGRIVVEGREHAEAELLGKLTNVARNFKDQAVILRGDGETAYINIVRVLNICQKAGIWNVAFATNRPPEEE